MSPRDQYRCDICGRFVSEDAVIFDISPDTEFSPETVTELCPKCAEGSQNANYCLTGEE